MVFKNGMALDDVGYELGSEGILSVPGVAPTLILAGVECTACDALPSLFIYSIATNQKVQLPFPGEFVSDERPETNEPDFKVRIFIGNCLKDYPNAIIAITQGRTGTTWSDPQLKIVALQSDGSLFEKNVSENVPAADTIEKNAPGQCKERKPGSN